MGLDSETFGGNPKSNHGRSALHIFSKWIRIKNDDDDNDFLDHGRSRREQFLSRLVRQAQQRLDSVRGKRRRDVQRAADQARGHRQGGASVQQLHISIDSNEMMMGSTSHPNLLSHSPPYTESGDTDLYTELEALQLSRQDNPVLLQLASQEHLDDSLGLSTGSLYCGLSPSLSPATHLMQTCMVRSPPPVSWPHESHDIAEEDAPNLYARSHSEERMLNSPTHGISHINVFENNNGSHGRHDDAVLSPQAEPRRNSYRRGMSCSMTQAEPVIRRNHSCQRDRRNSTSSTSVWRLNLRQNSSSRCEAKSMDDLDEGPLSPPNSLSPPPTLMSASLGPNMNNNNALNRSVSPIPGPTLFTRVKCLPLT